MDTRRIGSFSEGFTATLTNACFDACFADAHQVPLHVTFSVTTADATAASAGEGSAKRVAAVSRFGRGTLAARKAATLVTVSEDLLRFNSAPGLLEQSLRAGIADAVDKHLFVYINSRTTPIASSGATAANAMNDIRRVLDAATVTANSRFHLIVSPHDRGADGVFNDSDDRGLCISDAGCQRRHDGRHPGARFRPTHQYRGPG